MKIDLTDQDCEILINLISKVQCPIDQAQILLVIRNKLVDGLKKK